MFCKSLLVPTLAGAMLLLAGLEAVRAGQPIPEGKAYLVVKLPADARLLVGFSTTMQTGPERHFLSPPLKEGKKYSYELTATWMQNGKPFRQVRVATVSAGQRSVVDFLEPEIIPKPRIEKKDSEKKPPEKEN